MKKGYKKLLALLISCTMFVQMGVVSVYALENSPFKVKAYAIDTIAGLGTVMKSTQTLSDKEVIFNVKKPSGEKIRVSGYSDSTGVALVDFPESHTEKAGIYTVWAKLENTDYSQYSTFKVYADDVSAKTSTVESSNASATANGIDKIYITVGLKDRYSNPIEGHVILPMSENEDVNIQPLRKDNISNEEGEMIYSVSSNNKGLVSLSFMDTTSSLILEEKIKVAFLDNADDAKGGFIPVTYALSGEISRLEFEGLPSTIQTNADTGFTLTAYDSENDIVPNFNGEVHFSSEGDNSIYATLPNDYTFDVDLDEGTHTFSGINSLNFSQPGTFTVVATNLDDVSIRGQIDITVGTGSSTSTSFPSADEGDLVITSPSPGTYTDGELVIIGTGPMNSTIQVFDNETNVGETDVLNDGTFTFDGTIWTEGTHEVFTVALDAVGDTLGTSDTLSFTIDQSAPELDDIVFDPETGITTGDVIEIKVYSEPNLTGAIIFADDIVELVTDISRPDIYLATIQAPADADVYALDVILVDELGNEGIYEGVAEISVGLGGETEIAVDDEMLDEDEEIVEEEEEIVEEESLDDELETNQPPSDVFGVKAFSSDQKVTLFWQAALDDNEINNYRIYYGVTPFTLNNIVETSGNENTWYIPNLDNGVEYFFALVAVDSDGTESLSKSSIISTIPFSGQGLTPVDETEDEEDLKPISLQESGPEMILLLLLAFISGSMYFLFSNNHPSKKVS